ncbi:RNA-binding protein [Thermococcus sp. GR7]|uniref:archaeosine synthase subunit alpha n=1 Tax=unclassified Thermococcus TaxID=2627626 RepID=UPI0014310173|nr:MULTISPECIES: archaeosine synthase subunit alpha [unclassified Thermococcus]NJE46666.1 RNA-binding protein [Thermococcus sp. GR7]NJE77906.1 RNA-binding protein [Thermococcus sp. GR4]NJF23034.1 RNA-binding protein [Thermococcus sp. GR5]
MEVLRHEGPGRLGLVRLGEYSFRTPALAGVDFTLSPFNSFFHPKEPGDYDFNLAPAIPLGFYTPDEVIQKAIGRLWSINYEGFNAFYLPALRRMEYLPEFFKIIKRYGFEAVYLGNSKILIREYRYFVRILREIRERFPNIMIIADLEPFFYPLAVYLGVDAFDTRSLKLYDFAGKAFTQYSPFIWKEGGNSLDFARETILLVRKALEEGKLRYLVENFFPTQYNAGILRIADLEHGDYLEKYTPIQKETVYFISDASIRRPEVKRWHSRVVERFVPPKNTELLLLFPCSAKKPYSFSRSHTLYRKAVKEALGSGIAKVHELILTSPFGVVPREWEWLAKYDIVVTGHWSEEEIKPAAELLAKTLEKYPEDVPIIAHLDEAYVEIAKMAAEMTGREIIFTRVENGTTSKESLRSLTETLRELELEGTKEDRTYRYFEGIRKVFDFYFGIGAGEAVLPDKGQVKGSKMLRLFVDGQQTGTYKDGVISVTPFGMQRIYDATKSYWVKIDFDLRGDVFAVGVGEADERIRPDDIVGIVRDEKVVGVGKAVLSGEEMIRAKKGVAVKVRKRA